MKKKYEVSVKIVSILVVIGAIAIAAGYIYEKFIN